MNTNLKGKQYKLLLIAVKYIPIIIGLSYMVNTITSIFGIDLSFISIVSGMSLLTWIFMYLAAIVFKFCVYHRMFLWYVLVSDLVNLLDYFIPISYNAYMIFSIHFVTMGATLLIILYHYVRGNKETIGKGN